MPRPTRAPLRQPDHRLSRQLSSTRDPYQRESDRVTRVPTDTHRHWNHNTHYHGLVLGSVPPGARTALDVGTGDGLLAADLREKILHVTGIDMDNAVLDLARAARADVAWVVGDVMSAALPEEHFDVVACVATVHHLPDLEAALRRLASLTAPGGVLTVVGCARNSRPQDYFMDAIGAVQHQVFSRTRGYWQHNAPVVLHFPHTYAEVRDIATKTLPGVRWRRLPLFRYELRWSKTTH